MHLAGFNENNWLSYVHISDSLQCTQFFVSPGENWPSALNHGSEYVETLMPFRRSERFAAVCVWTRYSINDHSLYGLPATTKKEFMLRQLAVIETLFINYFYIKNQMKYFFIFIVLVAVNAGCKPKTISGAELENKLIETMNDYLHKTLQPGVEVTVKDVIYYPEVSKKLYICRFHVNMRLNNKDTTGVVAATISNDFNKVVRTQ